MRLGCISHILGLGPSPVLVGEVKTGRNLHCPSHSHHPQRYVTFSFSKQKISSPSLQKANDVPSTLLRGRMEGWVRVRVAGQTDWKKVWMAINGPSADPDDHGSIAGGGKKRMSNLFNRTSSPSRNAPTKPVISMFLSPKPKDRKKPLLTMSDISQAFAVYPERPELISRSTLIKVEGFFGGEDTAAGMKNREGWLLVMPELEGGLSQTAEMLRWVTGTCPWSDSGCVSKPILTALHDAFNLYGRPQAWSWDPRQRHSLMFAYPVGPQKDVGHFWLNRLLNLLTFLSIATFH
jgi:CCR4-NOT transcriptional complex subunit CAF120